MKARKQAKQSFLRSTRINYSSKHNIISINESSLEQDYYRWRHFELPSNANLVIQPDHTELFTKLGLPRYTPEGEFIEDDVKYVEEVKYKKEAELPKNKEKYKGIKNAYISEGIEFRILTEDDIRVGARADNLKLLTPSLRHPAPYEEFRLLVNGLKWKRLHINVLQARCDKLKLPGWLIRRAIAHKLFKCDLTNPYDSLVLSWD